jgi:hypothetical protein
MKKSGLILVLCLLAFAIVGCSYSVPQAQAPPASTVNNAATPPPAENTQTPPSDTPAIADNAQANGADSTSDTTIPVDANPDAGDITVPIVDTSGLS